jgi:hypothetical protein
VATHNAYTPANIVKLTAGRMAQDPDLSRLGDPFYGAAVRDAVRELCYDTAWDKRTKDYPMPVNGMLELPEGMSGAFHVYGYTGDNCDIFETTEIHTKPNFTHKGGTGYFALQKGTNIDAIVDNTFWWEETGVFGGLYYCGIEMGNVYFSRSCKRFSHVRLVYAGLGQDDECEVPAVPTWAQRAVEFFVARQACLHRMSEDARLFNLMEQKYSWELNNVMGAWRTAQMRYKQMDYKQRQDSNIYNTQFGHR